MCFQNPIRIKGISRYSPQCAFVPCGKCKECRENQKFGWTFRLRAEFEALQKRNWSFAFVTLTYNDKYLPHIPHVFLKKDAVDKYSGRLPMCFSKPHVRDFITKLRQWLFREFDAVKRVKDGVKIKDDGLRYLLGSEFGDHTRRSHYHMILAVPPYVPLRKLHEWIKREWSYGFVFPRRFEGGLDSHGYAHSPFVIDSVGCACAYASKYVCKDIGFFENVDLNDFRKKVIFDKEHVLGLPIRKKIAFKGAMTMRLSDYMPFHMQSKSLGSCFLDGLTESEKLDVLNNGFAFQGEFALRHLPVYLKNKLIYNNYYIFDKDGKRLCRRVANEFFKKHYEQIFEKKVDFTERMIKEVRSRQLEICKFVAHGYGKFIQSLERRLSMFDNRTLAEYYLACANVSKGTCYNSVTPARLWLSRYLCEQDSLGVYDIDYPDVTCLDPLFLDALSVYFDVGQRALGLMLQKTLDVDLLEQRKVDIIRQFFKENE